MGCIKPPRNVTEPTSRSAGRLALTLGKPAIDATTHGETTEYISNPASSQQADRLRNELAVLRTGAGPRKQLGDFSEAVAAGLAVSLMGHYLLQQHNPGDSSHGLDIQTVDSDGKLWTIEVKGTRTAGKRPRGDKYAVGRQTSALYVHDRSKKAHVTAPSPEAVGAEPDQMGSLLVQVNLPDNQVTVWDVDAFGKRAASPLERYSLDDAVAAIDSY